MVRRRVLAYFLVISVAISASFGVSFATAMSGSPLGSFYGGYHHVNLSSRENSSSSLTVELSFRTASYESGLVFLAFQNDHAGYLAAGLSDSVLEIVFKRATESPQTLHSFNFSFQNTSLSRSNWHSLSVHYHQSQLLVTLDSSNIHSQSLSLEEGFSDVFFAGMDSFLSHHLITDLSLAHFFTGCMANVSVNNIPVVFVPDHQNGIGTECCPIPRTPMWCFQSVHSNLSIPDVLHDNHSILISFNLQAVADGLVLFAQTKSQSLHLTLSGHNLSLVLSNTQEHGPETLDCPPLPEMGDWHTVEVALMSDSVRCTVDDRASNITTQQPLSFFSTDLMLGSADVKGVEHASFEGCIKHFRVNGAEIRPSLGNQLIPLHNGPVQWSELNFDLHPLTVNEGDKVRVSSQNIIMTLPEEIFSDESAFLWQEEIEATILIQAMEGPYQGSFVLGQSENIVSQFTYSSLTSQDNETQIFYQHSTSSENVTDEAIIQVSVECGRTSRTLFSGTLEITVIESMESPLIVTHNDAISIAAGTSRVIAPSHLTVVGRVNPNPDSVTFTLQSIEPMDVCEVDCGVARGKLFKTSNANLNRMYFSQEDINEGNISLQHFEKFGTKPLVIKLLASINGGGSINVTIDVFPYEGNIAFLTVPGVCLFVKEGSTALLEPEHLNTTTNFEEQDPVISYDLIQEPRYGYFERYIAYHDVLPDWHPLTSVSPVSSSRIEVLNYFTQDDVNSGHVRYVHNHSSIFTQESENFRFRLRSTNLTGASESLCIHIVAKAFLFQPLISITTGEIRVNESDEVIINRDLLTTTPSQNENGDYFTEVEDVEQMGIVYYLEAIPSFGRLVVGERELHKGDNFTFEEVSFGLLRYVHGKTEDHSDSFKIFAVATTTSTLLILTPEPSPVVTVTISILPVNNHMPQLSDNLTKIRPSEGGYVLITEENIHVTDEDRPKEVLTIYLRKKGAPPIGYFAFDHSPFTAISRFTMQNVTDEKVIFHHQLDPSASLEYTQILRLDDGNKSHYVRKPIYIQAVPLNLTVEKRVSGCLADIDATSELLSVTLQQSSFSFMLQDHFGEDKNLIPDVNVSVSSFPLYGQFNNRVSGKTNVSVFTVTELQEDAISYQFTGQSATIYRDDFSWKFTYGNSVVGLDQLQICISPIPIPQIVHINSVSVAIRGMVNLDSSNLFAINTRGGPHINDTLVYQIVRPPRKGAIIDGLSEIVGTNLTNFTQTDINRGRVVYQNRYSDMSHNMQDSFTFTVCTSHECTEPSEFVIRIQYVNLTVLNTGFSVNESGNHTITTNELNIFAPSGSTNLRFVVRTPPKHGNFTLEISGSVPGVEGVQYFNLDDIVTGRIFYRNDGHENLHDSFEFIATADYYNEVSKKYEPLHQFTDMVNITIIPVNDNRPEIVLSVPNMDAVKHGSTLISPTLFQAHDYDSDMDDVDIEWILKYDSPINGYMYLDEDRGKDNGISRWTEGELRANRVFYRNYQGDGFDIISYEVTDGELFSDVERTFLTLQPIIFVSNATIPLPIPVTEGGNITITTAHLSYYADNDQSLEDGDFLYTLISPPTHGVLKFRGEPIHKDFFFNQSELHHDSLVYIHDDTNSESDSFEYSLSVENRINTQYMFDFTIIPVDDDPPNVTILQDPLFVVELSHVQINSSVLEIHDHDSENDVEFDNIFSTVQSAPRYGLLPRQRFGKMLPQSGEFTKYDVVSNQLWYSHTSLGHYQDSFTFRITDGINPQNETYEVHIVILPNQVSLQLRNISVEEGQVVPLESRDFKIEHAYLSKVPGRFNVTRPPAYGVLSNKNTKLSISEFTTSDLSNDSIVYNHSNNGREILLDSFDFYFESLEPEGLHRKSATKTMFISITPVDDEPPIFKRRSFSTDIISGQKLVLNEHYLNVTDSDTPPSQLNYTFTLNINGYIAYANNTRKSIHWFTHSDVIAGRVIFIHDILENIGSIEFNVTDGKQYATATRSFSIFRLSLKCDSSDWSDISVNAGGEVAITESHLDCSIFAPRSIGDIPITFFVDVPRHGYITVGNEVRNNFTKEEIKQNMVRYVHNDFEFWEEMEQLNASATANYVDPLPFQLVIHIHYRRSNTSVLAANQGLQLDEGAYTCLNKTLLDVRNLRYSAWIGAKRNGHIHDLTFPRDLVPVFNMTRLPDHGKVMLNSTIIYTLPVSFTHSDVDRGDVCYQHSGSERFEDSIHFQLYFLLRGNNSTPLVFTGNQTFLNSVRERISIKITPINDERPKLVTGKNLTLQLVLGFTTNITRKELNVVDEDSPASNITFSLLALPQSPQSARLFLGDRELSANAEFTQADVNDHQLQIVPNSITSMPEKFILSYKDELDVQNPETVTINYNVSEHRLTLLTNKVVTYQQNEKEVVIAEDCLNTKTNSYRSDTLFTVVSGPVNGRIVVERGSGSANGFSQTAIDERKVKYIPNSDATSYEDKVSLRVLNKDLDLNVTVSFTSLAWGSVREDASIILTSTSLSQPLPSDLLNLLPDKPPEIHVIDKPRYGMLEVGPVKQGDQNFTFHYDDLVRGWVRYTWDYDQPVYTDTLVDNFTMVVLVKDMPPGKARISLRVHPPESYRVSVTTQPSDVTENPHGPIIQNTYPQTNSNSEGFPMYSLVLILGVFVILVIMIVVIALFCTTQQKRIRRKWQPGEARPPGPRMYPWSVDSHNTSGPRAMAPPNYNFDPACQSGESDNEEHNSETSSGFSEPVISPRHSPTQAFSLPQQSSQPGSYRTTYGTPSLVPPRTRSRVRSNVSITFSSRQSVASDVSIEDSQHYYSHSLPRPPPQDGLIVVPTPVRPASHSAFSRVPRLAVMESGYNSGMFHHGGEDSGAPSRAGSCAGYEDDCELPPFPSADVPLGLDERINSCSTTLPTLSCPSDAGPGPIELKSSLAIGDEDFLNLNDPNILQMLRSPNPVLRKEEYWV